MIIKLMNSKIERLSQALQEKMQKEAIVELAEFSQEVQMKENGLVREIVDSLPSMMKLVSENISLKEQLNYSDENDVLARAKILDQLGQNVSFLQVLCQKIDDGALETKERIYSQTKSRSEFSGSVDTEDMIREKVERIRSEYNEKIEELNVEIFDSERLVQDLQKALDKEKLVSELLRNEVSAVQTQRARAEEDHNARMRELMTEFETIQATNLSATKVEELNQELTIRVLETKEKLNDSMARNEELVMLVKEKEEQLLITNQRMEFVEQQLKDVSEKKLRDSLGYEQQINELKIKLNEMESDWKDAQKVIEGLKFSMSITEDEKNQVENLLEATKNELNDAGLRHCGEKTEFQAQIAGISENLMKSEERLGLSQSQIEELQRKLALKTEETEELKQKALASENELEGFKNEMNRILNELQSEFDQRNQLQEAETEKRIRDFESDFNQRLEAKEDLFRQEVEALELNMKSIDQRNMELVSENQRLLEETNHLKENLQQKEAEISKKITNYESEFNQKENIFRQEVEALEASKQQIMQKYTELISENERLVQEISHLKENIQQQEVDMNIRIRDCETDFTQRMEAKEAHFKQEIETLEVKMKRVEQRNSELTSENGHLAEELNDAIDCLQHQKQGNNEAVETERLQLEVLQGELNRAKAEVLLEQEERERLEKLKREYDESQERDALKKERDSEKISQLNNVISGLKRKLKDADQGQEQEKQNFEKMKLEYEEIQQQDSMIKEQYLTEIDQLNKVIDELKTKLDETEHHLSDIEAVRQELIEQHKKQEAFWSSMADEEEAKRTQLKIDYELIFAYTKVKYETELSELKQAHAAELEQIDLRHTEELHEIDEQRKIFLEQLSQKSRMEELTNSHLHKLETLQSELVHYKKRCLELEEITGLSEQYDDLLRANHDLRNCLNDQQERNNLLQRDLHAKENQISELNSLMIQKKKDSAQRELKEIQDQYVQMRKEHKNLIANFGMKEGQIKSLKEELSEAIEEKERLNAELEVLRPIESKLRKENQEYSEKIAKMNSEQFLLLKELDHLNKANDTLAGHNNNDQKIRHLNKLKEENSKLKDEKLKLVDELAKMQESTLRMQRKMDEMTGTGGKLRTARDSDDSERYRIENKMWSDNFERIVQLLRDGLNPEEFKRYNLNSKDTDAVVSALQQVIRNIVEQSKYIQSMQLQNSILEKELLLYKQKIQLKKQQQSQSSLSSQALGPLSNNVLFGTNSHFQMMKNRENSMKIEDQTPNNENERKAKGPLFEQRY